MPLLYQPAHPVPLASSAPILCKSLRGRYQCWLRRAHAAQKTATVRAIRRYRSGHDFSAHPPLFARRRQDGRRAIAQARGRPGARCFLPLSFWLTIGSMKRGATVQAGYNTIAAAYLRARTTASPDVLALDQLLTRLSLGAWVLDAGCGAGLPIAARLAAAGHRVVGVDFADVPFRIDD